MPTMSEGHLARSLERRRARCPGKAARKGTRTAWGQYESEGAFPAFSSTHPKKTPGSELIQPGADQHRRGIRQSGEKAVAAWRDLGGLKLAKLTRDRRIDIVPSIGVMIPSWGSD